MRLDRALDQFDSELALRGCVKRSRSDYFRKLSPLCGFLPDADVASVTEGDCRAYLDRWRDKHPNTMRHSISVLKSFFGWLYDVGEIGSNPMERISLRAGRTRMTSTSRPCPGLTCGACSMPARAGLICSAWRLLRISGRADGRRRTCAGGMSTSSGARSGSVKRAAR